MNSNLSIEDFESIFGESDQYQMVNKNSSSELGTQ